MAGKGSVPFRTVSSAEGKPAVPEFEVKSMARGLLRIMPAPGDVRDTFRDPAMQAEYELWKKDREAWLEKYHKGA